MYKKSLMFRLLGIAALLTSVLVTVRAQSDADGEMVSEEMTMDDALSTDLGAGAEIDPALLESEAVDLAAAAEMEALMVDEGTGATDAVSADVAADMDAGAEDLATLDVGLPAEASTELPSDDAALDAGDMAAADDLGALEMESEKGEPAEVADLTTEVAGDDLSGLDMGEPAVADSTETSDMESDMEAVDIDSLLAEEAEVAIAPAQEAPEQNPDARQSQSPGDNAVQILREGEELRRRAFVEHAMEKLGMADQAFTDMDYVESERLYLQAANALEQAGGRPENRVELKRARNGVLESLYHRAVTMRKDGDLVNARKIASTAALEGHPLSSALVNRIDKDMEKPVPPPPREKVRWQQDDFKKKAEDVKSHLHKGRQFYLANELDKAQLEFEEVLQIDAHNTEAIRWREKVTQTRYERASMELETTRKDMSSQVREAWNPRSYGAGGEPKAVVEDNTTITAKISEADRITAKMASITIPEIDFRQANINDVVTFLQEQSVEGDPEGRGVNIILNLSSAEGGGAVMQPSYAEFGDFSAEAPILAGPASFELITFRAREISLFDALKILTDVANLKYRIAGNVVMILPLNAPDGKIVHRMYPVLPSVGERISAIRESAFAEPSGGDFGTLGDGASMADTGTDWKAFFSDLGVEWPTGSSIRHVPAIGQLMVANTADNLALFEDRLAALNVVPKQIEIEARFVEVNQTDLNSLGLEWLLTDEWEVATKKGDANLPLAAQQRIVVPKTDFTDGNRFVADNRLIHTAPAGLRTADDSILSIASVLTNPEISVILHALEQKGNSDLLSAPKVTTQSGIEAQIKVVTEYIYPSAYDIEPSVPPVITGDAIAAGTPPVVTPAEFETREVGVILTVLPEVSTEGEMINLTMSPEVVTEPTWRDYGQTFTDGQGNITKIPIEQPFFHSRSISTSILIYNGATVVMGGMITEDRQQVDDRIPFLGDIPLIGRLFRSTYDHSIKRNLLIFVTARLVDPAGRPVGAAVPKMQQPDAFSIIAKDK